MEGVVIHDFRFRLKEPTKKEYQQVTAVKAPLRHKQKKKGALHHQSENCSGVRQSPFLCLCNSGNMVFNLLMMVFLRIKSLLRKNLSMERKKQDYYFCI